MARQKKKTESQRTTIRYPEQPERIGTFDPVAGITLAEDSVVGRDGPPGRPQSETNGAPGQPKRSGDASVVSGNRALPNCVLDDSLERCHGGLRPVLLFAAHPSTMTVLWPLLGTTFAQLTQSTHLEGIP